MGCGARVEQNPSHGTLSRGASSAFRGSSPPLFIKSRARDPGCGRVHDRCQQDGAGAWCWPWTQWAPVVQARSEGGGSLGLRPGPG
eukprot:8455885-Pyramimonas_sp.AAC.1